jgi:hypothetical protein
MRWSRKALYGAVAVMIAALLTPGGGAAVPEDRSGLTRASFRRNCLMCHSKAAPEGVSAEILAGLHPVPGLKPFDAMPGILCWRRCEACKLPDPSAARRPAR